MNRKKQYKSILVLPDIHMPWPHWDALKQAKKWADKHKPELVVQLGDLTDQKIWSRWQHDVDDYSPSQEFEEAEKGLKLLHKWFPKMVILRGNHDERIKLRAVEAGLPGKMFRDVDDVFAYPGWEWVGREENLIVNTPRGKVLFQHGDEMGGTVAQKSRILGMSVVQGHCLREMDEVLTLNRGFVRLRDIELTDTVYGYDHTAHQLVPTEVLEITKKVYTGRMYKFNLSKFSQTVTENHHFKLRDGRYIPLSQCLEENLKLSDFPRLGLSVDDSASDYPIADDMLRLMVAVAADGSFEPRTGNQNTVRFHLKHTRKVERLTQLVRNLGYEIGWSPSYGGRVKSTGFSLELRSQLRELFNNEKIIPEWFITELSKRQRSVVAEELHMWDGSHLCNESYQFCSSKEEEIDRVQRLLTSIGILSNKISGRHGAYVVTYNKSEDTHPNADRFIRDYVEISEVEEQAVACITTAYQSFVCRTMEGSVEITGNTHKTSITYTQTPTGHFFGAEMGCLMDVKSKAARYAQANPVGSSIGFGVLKYGVPYFISYGKGLGV